MGKGSDTSLTRVAAPQLYPGCVAFLCCQSRRCWHEAAPESCEGCSGRAVPWHFLLSAPPCSLPYQFAPPETQEGSWLKDPSEIK